MTMVAVVAVVVVVAAVAGVAVYRMRTLPDTRDLARQVDRAAEDALQESDLGTVAVAVLRDGRLHVRRLGTHAGGAADTVRFEIGSISKVFTVLAAQRLVDEGVWRWSDPIWPLLPPDTRPATDDGTTLEMLATHTSGLPRLPQRWFARLEATDDPYAALTPADVFEAYAAGEERVPWARAPDEYSNFGLGLLGHLLERKTGEPYEALLQRLVVGPLGLAHTSISLDAREAQQLVPGRDEAGAPSPPWTFGALAGAGAYRSTIEDMAAFLRAAVAQDPAAGLSWQGTWTPRRSAAGHRVALGWQLDDVSGRFVGVRRIVWHNGGTGGFSSWIGFDPERRIGAVVLAARSNSAAVDELGLVLLMMTSHISFGP